jgi:preprotein translocase subunit SecG
VGFVLGLLTVVFFITCITLIIVVLMQEPKGGGLSSAFGGSGLDTAFGASIGRKMSSFTIYLAVFFLILTVVLAILGMSGTGTISGSMMEGMGEKKAPGATGGQPAPKKEKKAAGPEKEKGAKAPESPKEAGKGQPKADAPPANASEPGGKTPAAPKEDK